MAEHKRVDWEAVEKQYRAGVRTLRDIAEEHGCSHVAIQKKAAKEGWTRDLGAKIRAAADALVTLPPADVMEQAGFLYVIYLDSGTDRFYKIGLAKVFSARFSAHQCASPFPVCVACAYFVGNMRLEEKSLHHIFADKKVRGEWFRLGDEDLDYIATRARIA